METLLSLIFSALALLWAPAPPPSLVPAPPTTIVRSVHDTTTWDARPGDTVVLTDMGAEACADAGGTFDGDDACTDVDF